ncbi:MAG: hypothetical protein Q9225_001202 [Loekoesia sp. 1 TL-2023]
MDILELVNTRLRKSYCLQSLRSLTSPINIYRQLLPQTKLLDNHQLIDPVAAVYERGMPEYQGLRRYVRKGILDSIATSQSLRDVTWIFTDSQSSGEVGATAVADYIHAAQTRGSLLISVILTCDGDENVRRMTSKQRGKTKLNDVSILLDIRRDEDLYRFGGKAELELDVSQLSVASAAQTIAEFITKTTFIAVE